MPTFEIPATYVETDVLVPNPSWWTSGLAWVVLSSGTVTVLGSNLTPNGYSVSLDGSAPPSPSPGATSSLHVTAPDGIPASLGYADVQYFPTGIWHERWGSAYGGLHVSATATRDEGYGVALAVTAGAGCPDPPRLQSDVAIDHFHIDWGDGTTEDVDPATSVFSGIGGNTSYAATATASHTFSGPESSTGITVSAVQGEDYPQEVATPNIPPRAKFTYEVIDLTVFLNALESDDIDGTIVDYDWLYFSPGTETGNPPIFPTYTFDRPNLDGNQIRLTVTDSDGATAVDTQTIGLFLRGESLLDRHGRLFTTAPEPARNGYGTLRLYYDPLNLSHYEEIPNPGSPGGGVVALWQDDTDRLFYLLGGNLYESFTNGLTPFYWLTCSNNDGLTWQEEVAFLLMFNGFYGVHGCALRGGGHALAGVDGTDNKIKCSITLDAEAREANWQTPVEVADYPGSNSRQLFIFQQHMAGSAQIVIFHPASGTRWTSKDFGSTWEMG